MTLNKIATTAAILATGTSTAFAGGLERSTFSSSILFEEGTYIEAVHARTITNVTSDTGPLGASQDPTGNFSTTNFGIKHDFNDKFSAALIFNGQPLGADINYQTPLTAGAFTPQGFINSSQFDLLGRYKFNDNFSVYGGLRYQTVSATADLGILALRGTPSAALASTAANFAKESELGYIGGVAYERKEIALRATLTYESEIEYELNTSNAAGASLGTTNASSAEAWTLEFQTGVAPKTLAFGKIRYSKTGSANVSVLGESLTTFDDTTTYTLGVGRKLSDKVSGSFSLFYEASDGEPSSLFGPTDGIFGGNVGFSVDVGKGVKIGAGISISNRGDTNAAPLPITFSNNSVTTVGFKVSKQF